MFNKKVSEFNQQKRDLFKRLTEIELDVKDPVLRKRITALVDKTYNLKPSKNTNAKKKFEEVIKYIKELKKELINPVDLIIHNYSDKIECLINELIVESEA